MSYRMTLGIALLAVGLGGVVAAQPPARSLHLHGDVAAASSPAAVKPAVGAMAQSPSSGPAADSQHISASPR